MSGAEMRSLRSTMERGFERLDEKFDRKIDRQFMWLTGIMMTGFIGVVSMLFRLFERLP
jgi:hypothetical protein